MHMCMWRIHTCMWYMHQHVCGVHMSAHVLQTPGHGGREQRLDRLTHTSLWVSQLLSPRGPVDPFP